MGPPNLCYTTPCPDAVVDTNIGRRIARDNRLVVGTKEAMREEMIGLFGDMEGEVVKKMRARVEEVSVELKKDRESGGSFDAVVRLSKVGQ